MPDIPPEVRIELNRTHDYLLSPPFSAGDDREPGTYYLILIKLKCLEKDLAKKCPTAFSVFKGIDKELQWLVSLMNKHPPTKGVPAKDEIIPKGEGFLQYYDPEICDYKPLERSACAIINALDKMGLLPLAQCQTPEVAEETDGGKVQRVDAGVGPGAAAQAVETHKEATAALNEAFVWLEKAQENQSGKQYFEPMIAPVFLRAKATADTDTLEALQKRLDEIIGSIKGTAAWEADLVRFGAVQQAKKQAQSPSHLSFSIRYDSGRSPLMFFVDYLEKARLCITTVLMQAPDAVWLLHGADEALLARASEAFGRIAEAQKQGFIPNWGELTKEWVFQESGLKPVDNGFESALYNLYMRETGISFHVIEEEWTWDEYIALAEQAARIALKKAAVPVQTDADIETTKQASGGIAKIIGAKEWKEIELIVTGSGIRVRKTGMIDWYPAGPKCIRWEKLCMKASQECRYFQIFTQILEGKGSAAKKKGNDYNSALHDLNEKFRNAFGLSGQAFKATGNITQATFATFGVERAIP